MRLHSASQFLRVACLLWLGSVGLCQAHVVQQMFGEFRPIEGSWEFEVLFDAGYADPETRGDLDAPQPTRQWLVDRDSVAQALLRVQTEAYLREILKFSAGSISFEWDVRFLDFDSDPPDFPRLLNDGAYLRVLITPRAGDLVSGLSINLASSAQPNFVVGMSEGGEERYLTLNPGGSELLVNPLEIPGGSASGTAFLQGFLHVVPKGLDHILFVVGIFLLQRSWRSLLSQSLAFTAAHTITLGLAAAGKISVPSEIVEPVIALSITALAVENLFVKEAKPWRLGVVFLFGLVHGLGFAGVLSTWIRPGDRFLTSLLSANLGVEAGQLLVLLVAWLLTFHIHRGNAWPKFRKWSCVILALTGFWWFAERVNWL